MSWWNHSEMGFMKGQCKREVGLSTRSPRAGKKLVLRSCSGVGGCSKDGGMWPQVTQVYVITSSEAGPNATNICTLDIQVVFTSAIRMHRDCIVKSHGFLDRELHLVCIATHQTQLGNCLLLSWGSCEPAHSLKAGRLPSSQIMEAHR